MSSPEIILLITSFLLGLIVGSFLNVCILRIPIGESIVSPPSHCPHCSTQLRWWQNIPIISYVYLRGKCYCCNKSISSRYPIVELITGLLFLWSFTQFGISISFLSAIIFISYMIIIGVIDYEHYLIYDVLSISGIMIGFLLAGITMNLEILLKSALGFIIGAGSLLIIRSIGNMIFKKETMGLGDIKLAGLIGVFLGWPKLLLSIFFASILILIVAGIQQWIDKKKYTGRYPFGFYLCLTAIIFLFFGNSVILFYMEYLT